MLGIPKQYNLPTLNSDSFLHRNPNGCSKFRSRLVSLEWFARLAAGIPHVFLRFRRFNGQNPSPALFPLQSEQVSYLKT